MNYEVLLFDRSGRKLEVSVLHESDSPAELEAWLTGKTARVVAKGSVVPSVKRGAKGRPVVVQSKESGCVSPVAAGDMFDSASELSVALGYNFNAVSLYLNLAKGKNETTATLRGVTVQYVDTVEGRV